MLNIVFNLIQTIKTIAYYSVILSYNTGKVIVNGLVGCFGILQKLFETLWTVLVILHEDLFVFLSDVYSKFVQIFHEFHVLAEYIGDCVVTVINNIKYIIFGMSSALIMAVQNVVTAISKTVSICGALIAGIKHLIVLFGSGVWFALTLIPLFCMYVWLMIGYYVGKIFEEMKAITYLTFDQITTKIQDLFNFVTDVPFESLAGLMICFCLIYAVMTFHLALLNNFNRFLRFLITVTHRNVLRVKSLLFRRIVTRENISESDSDTSSSNSEYIEEEIEIPESCPGTNEGWKTKRQRQREIMESGERLCIICLERNKCILAMPCRHMCTCKECNDTLRNYQRTCPICRRYITYTIHVY